MRPALALQSRPGAGRRAHTSGRWVDCRQSSRRCSTRCVAGTWTPPRRSSGLPGFRTAISASPGSTCIGSCARARRRRCSPRARPRSRWRRSRRRCTTAAPAACSSRGQTPRRARPCARCSPVRRTMRGRGRSGSARSVPETEGLAVMVSAGTSDGPVLHEARIRAELLGTEVVVHEDVGVAGIHRLGVGAPRSRACRLRRRRGRNGRRVGERRRRPRRLSRDRRADERRLRLREGRRDGPERDALLLRRRACRRRHRRRLRRRHDRRPHRPTRPVAANEPQRRPIAPPGWGVFHPPPGASLSAKSARKAHALCRFGAGFEPSCLSRLRGRHRRRHAAGGAPRRRRGRAHTAGDSGPAAPRRGRDRRRTDRAARDRRAPRARRAAAGSAAANLARHAGADRRGGPARTPAGARPGRLRPSRTGRGDGARCSRRRRPLPRARRRRHARRRLRRRGPPREPRRRPDPLLAAARTPAASWRRRTASCRCRRRRRSSCCAAPSSRAPTAGASSSRRPAPRSPSTLAESFGGLPPLLLESIGYGAGTDDSPDRPNRAPGAARSGRAGAVGSEVALLETNLDDLNPELVPDAVERCFAAGALDVWTAPVLMKKGRPGIVLSALARPADERAVAAAVLEETSALGVRVSRAAPLRARAGGAGRRARRRSGAGQARPTERPGRQRRARARRLRRARAPHAGAR